MPVVVWAGREDIKGDTLPHHTLSNNTPVHALS